MFVISPTGMLTIGVRPTPGENGESDDLHSSPSPLIPASRLGGGSGGDGGGGSGVGGNLTTDGFKGASSQQSLIGAGIEGSPGGPVRLSSVRGKAITIRLNLIVNHSPIVQYFRWAR